jgi:hypothetical protein
VTKHQVVEGKKGQRQAHVRDDVLSCTLGASCRVHATQHQLRVAGHRLWSCISQSPMLPMLLMLPLPPVPLPP